MKASLSAVIAALESAAIALAVFAVLGVTGFLLWWFTFSLEAEPASVLAGVSAVWMLSHFVPIAFTVTPELVLVFGIPPEASSFVLSFVPLGLTLVTVLLAMRLGARAGHRGGSGIITVTGGVMGFALAATVIALFAQPFLQGTVLVAVLVPALVFTVSACVGFLWAAIGEPHLWWETLSRNVLKLIQRAFPGLVKVLPRLLAEVGRLVGAVLVLLTMLGALSVFVVLAVGYVDVVSISQALQLTTFGIVVLFLFHIAVLPVAVIWAIAWLSGAGFSVGEGSIYSPFFTNAVPLPAVPFVGALPESWGWAAGLAPAIIICICSVVGAVHAGSVRFKRQTALVATFVPILAAVVVGVLVGFIGSLAGGAFGPGLFVFSGIDNWFFAAVLTGECAVGLLLGIWGRRLEIAMRGRGNTGSTAAQHHPIEMASRLEAAIASPMIPTTVTKVEEESDEGHPEGSLPNIEPTGAIDQSTEALIRQYAWQLTSEETVHAVTTRSETHRDGEHGDDYSVGILNAGPQGETPASEMSAAGSSRRNRITALIKSFKGITSKKLDQAERND